MIQRILAIWFMVPLPFLKPAWTSESSWFTYCWSLAWRILSISKCYMLAGSQLRGWNWSLQFTVFTWSVHIPLQVSPDLPPFSRWCPRVHQALDAVAEGVGSAEGNRVQCPPGAGAVMEVHTLRQVCPGLSLGSKWDLISLWLYLDSCILLHFQKDSEAVHRTPAMYQASYLHSLLHLVLAVPCLLCPHPFPRGWDWV